MSDRIPAEVFPPGEFLNDELEARRSTQTEFAEIIGRPPRVVNEVIAGKRGITPETARRHRRRSRNECAALDEPGGRLSPLKGPAAR